MKQYIYDGTFEGLLSAIFLAYTEKGPVEIIRAEGMCVNLFAQQIEVVTDLERYERVYKSISKKFSMATMKRIYHLYLSEIEGAETLAYQYIKLLFAHSDSINLAKNNDIIIQVDTYSRKVTLEAHRFHGFIRFKEVAQDVFYAKIAPDHHILPLLVEHFVERYSSQSFIIHDTKRKQALVYDQEKYYMRQLSEEENEKLRHTVYVDVYETLFKQYFKSTTIQERTNLRQQKLYMPHRYWKNIGEL